MGPEDSGNWLQEKLDSLAADSLESEALTMWLIRRSTSIPVPEVYAFDSFVNNEIGCPYILMEFVEGMTLQPGWYHSPKVNREQFQAKALEEVAEAMVQLNKLTFNIGGSLSFSKSGKAVDWPASHDPVDPETTPYCEQRSTDDPKAFMLALADRAEASLKHSDYEPGLFKLLRILIDWHSECENKEGLDPKFVLAHPDFDSQNTLVDEDGSLRAIIDWGGVPVVSHSVGCQIYPKWLMKDWEPLTYDYDTSARTSLATGYEESSPAELARYRAIYARFMKTALERLSATDPSVHTGNEALTESSLMLGSLERAARNPFFTTGVMEHVLKEIGSVTRGWDESRTNVFIACRQYRQEKYGRALLAGPHCTTITDAIGQSRICTSSATECTWRSVFQPYEISTEVDGPADAIVRHSGTQNSTATEPCKP